MADPPTTRTLSEDASKAILSRFGVPIAAEEVVSDPESAVAAARRLGMPVAVKLCGDAIAHKTERGLVRLGLADDESVRMASQELLAAATSEDGEVGLLVSPMVHGSRELIAGLVRDPQFGMTVLVGIGGVFTEALGDVSIRLVPIERVDADEMLEDLHHQALLGPFRGEPAVDRGAVVDVLMALSRAAEAESTLVSADVNPLIISDGVPVAVDALVEVTQ